MVSWWGVLKPEETSGLHLASWTAHIHLSVGIVWGVIFALIASRIGLHGVTAIVGGVVYGLLVMLFMAYIGLSITAAVLRGGDMVSEGARTGAQRTIVCAISAWIRLSTGSRAPKRQNALSSLGPQRSWSMAATRSRLRTPVSVSRAVSSRRPTG